MANNVIKIVKDKKNEKYKDISNTKIPFKFDIGILNMFIGYIFKKSAQVNRKTLLNMYTLISLTDESTYTMNENAYMRLVFIERALHAKVKEGMENEEMVINYCRTDTTNKVTEDIINNIPSYIKVNYEEIKHINKLVEDRLRYSFMLKYKDMIYGAVERLDTGDYSSFKEVNDELYDVARRIVVDSRAVSAVDDENMFSLEDGIFDSKVTDIVAELKNPSRILKTGIKALNEILAPGLLSKRLYTFFGLPGGYKSMIMLKLMLDIKKYNGHIEASKPGKRPCILMVTLENSVAETVERIFNMAIVPENIREFTPKQVIKMMKETGGLTITEDNDIDIIIKYYDNRAIDTMYLYTLIDDLADQGKEVICLFLDYLKRIKSTEYAKDEKEELKHVTNELKCLANEYDIAVNLIAAS